MSAHTPGPWDRRIEYDSLRDEIGARGKAVCIVWVRKVDGVLSDERQVVSDPEGEANASLIAAAPEMLDALESAESVLRQAGCDATARMVRAVIAKARGAA